MDSTNEEEMIKRSIIYTLLLLFSVSGIAAKTTQVPSMNDPKAKAVLDKAGEVYKQNTGIYSKFTQTVEAPGAKTTIKTGEIFLKGNKYKIIFPDQEVYCNEKSVWTFLKDVNQVQINDYEPDPSNISPSNMFNIYQKDFNYIKIADESVNQKTCHVVDLTPIDKSRTYFKVRIWINKETNLLSKIKIFDKNGYRYTYAITSINNKAKIEESTFIFHKEQYPKVKIEDLRF